MFSCQLFFGTFMFSLAFEFSCICKKHIVTFDRDFKIVKMVVIVQSMLASKI